MFGVESQPIFYVDDNQQTFASMMSYETQIQGKEMIPIMKAKKHGDFNIIARQHFINTAVPLGDVVLLEGNEILVEEFIRCVEGTTPGKRDEAKGKNKLNKINSAEYAL